MAASERRSQEAASKADIDGWTVKKNVCRAAIEVEFIASLFYANLLMGGI